MRQRYEKLQTNDLPAVISEQNADMDVDIDNDSDDEDSDADIQSMNQVSVKPSSDNSNFFTIKL